MPVTLSGFNSDFNTAELTKKLVDLERRPIERLQREKKDIQLEKSTWKNLKEKLQIFEKVVNKLYGFDRIFRKRKIYSDQEDFLSSTVKDNADKGEHTIEIKNLARAHKIITDKIPAEKKLPGATFTIQVGEEEIKVTGFQKGGTITRLAKVLRDEAKKLIEVRKLKADKDNIILSIESKKTGKKNSINIIDDSEKIKKLFKELGLVKIEKPTALQYDFNNKQPLNLQFYDNGYKNTPALFIQAKQKAALSIGKKIDHGVIEFVYKTIIPQKEEQITGKHVSRKSIDHVQIKDVIIYGANIILNKMNGTPLKQEKGNASVEILDKNNNNIQINLKNTNNWQTCKVELKDLKDIQSVNIINNSEVHYIIDNLKIFSKDDEKKTFKNVTQSPEDAEFKIDGVDLTRDRNKNLDDIIDGVTLNLLKKTPEPVKIEIKEDREKIETCLNDFVNQYNNILGYIINSMKSSTKSKPGKSDEDSGILSNDISLMNLHSKLRATAVGSYPTSFGNKLSMLVQMGISTGKWGSDWDNIRKGFLLFDKAKFDSAFNSFGDEISELFGYDTDKNNTIDTGVGYTLDKVIEPFSQRRGVIEGKISLTDVMIAAKDDAIKRKEKEVANYEDNLRKKFGKMEQRLNSLKANEKAFDNQMNALPRTSSAGKKE